MDNCRLPQNHPFQGSSSESGPLCTPHPRPGKSSHLRGLHRPNHLEGPCWGPAVTWDTRAGCPLCLCHPESFAFKKKKKARSPQIGSAKCIPQAGPPQGAQREQVKEKPRDASVVKREQGSRSHPSLGQVDSSPTNLAESPSRAGTCHMSKATSEKVCRAKRGHRSLPAVLAPQSDPAPSPQPPRLSGPEWVGVATGGSLAPQDWSRKGKKQQRAQNSNSQAAKDTGTGG